MRINWPEDKDFAFTVFDDTDHSTLENTKEVYSFLEDLGFRTTKSVWPLQGDTSPKIGGTTCEDHDYLEWLISLKIAGFEIGCHNATFHSSSRSDTVRGLDKFAELFGHYPKSMANHTGNRESIYWGKYRITGVNRLIYSILTLNRRNGTFRGHIKGDKYFWGDVCRDRVKYVRNFVFSDINTLKACPIMPYHDPQKPYVNYWFASSDGSDMRSFNECIAERHQDRLEEEGGACIMYTHFAKSFQNAGGIDPRFKLLMRRLSKKNGWFVPVSTLLDYLLKVKGRHIITDEERRLIERKWLIYKIRVGTK